MTIDRLLNRHDPSNQRQQTLGWLPGSGGDAKLGATIEVTSDRQDLKAPEADLGLGIWFEINQQEAYFYAPGAVEATNSLYAFLNIAFRLHSFTKMKVMFVQI